MLHHHEDALGADGQVHCAADGGDGVLRAGVPVGQVTVGGDLEGAQHADVQMAAAHHAEGVGVVEKRCARFQADRFLAGVDHVPVLFAGLGAGPAAEHAVLAVQEDVLVRRQVVGHQRR
ncbi:hypothetical protein D9M69_664340 [compost metagenome]